MEKKIKRKIKRNVNKKILKSIGRIYELSEGCKLESSFFETIAGDLSLLSNYFGTSQSQAFFIAMVFALNYKGKTVDLNDLISYFLAKGIFEKKQVHYGIKLAGANYQFTFNEKISEAILQNRPMPEIGNETYADVIELLEKLYKLGEQRVQEEGSTLAMVRRASDLITSNLQFPLMKQVNDFDFPIADNFLFLYLIWKTLSGNQTTDVGRALEGIFDNSSNRLNYMQKFIFGENSLIKNNLVEIIEAGFFNDTEMKLSDASLSMLNECDLKLVIKRKKKNNIIAPADIPARELIFNEAEMGQLALLKNLLEASNLSATQERLISKGLPQGVTVLLHGAPGTGKTESVKQLAKETGRDIMKVEISQSKSMWFGESEKIIKRIFTDYQAFSKECEQTPILMFNEADAIISKRREVDDSGVGQTQNTIQNILLEELENFEGILIATTNLANNLDSAFERRFLFKIEFQKPDIAVKAKIWNLKLPQLSKSECESLAKQFDFTGGQIDNIVRKNEIHEIIYGSTVVFNRIFDFCLEETMGKNRTGIGFN